MEPLIKYESCDDFYEASSQNPAEENQTENRINNGKRDFEEIQHRLPSGQCQQEQRHLGTMSSTIPNDFDLFAIHQPQIPVLEYPSNTNDATPPPKKYRRGEGNILFNAPFFQLLDDLHLVAHKGPISARCYSCGIVVKGSKNVSSNFIKHMKRAHPEINKMYDTYKIHRIRTGVIPTLHGGNQTKKISLPKAAVSNNGDLLENHSSAFDASIFLEASEIQEEEGNSEISEPDAETMPNSSENGELYDSSKESVPQKLASFTQPHSASSADDGSIKERETNAIDLSQKTLYLIGEMMNEKLKEFVTQNEFKNLSKVVEEAMGKKQTPTADFNLASITELRKEIDLLKSESKSLNLLVKQLQASKHKMNCELYTMERSLNQRKILIKNLRILDTSQPQQAVETLLQQRLGLEGIPLLNVTVLPSTSKTNISNTAKETVLLELKHEQDSSKIFAQSYKLKNSGIFIEPELSLFQRKRREKLLVLRKELLRRKPDLKVTIRNATLLVNGQNFYWCDIQGLCHATNHTETLQINATEYLKSLTGIDLNEFITILQNYDVQMR
uniref:BED-type domain-containing protein n=1 Tax=Glossina palpalis gambiensis TaxID=67801 RepID=A0A1B0APE9_9MUSC